MSHYLRTSAPISLNPPLLLGRLVTYLRGTGLWSGLLDLRKEWEMFFERLVFQGRAAVSVPCERCSSMGFY